MDSNRVLLESFYSSLARDDHEAVAACYHPQATFEDIAFDLKNKQQIHAMWHMITEADLKLTYTIERCNDRAGVVRWIADYTFKGTGKDNGRPVHNEVRSTFVLKDGLIAEHRDHSDAWTWCMQALGPIEGPLAWLFPAKRRERAAKKLEDFVKQNPQYQQGWTAATPTGVS